MTEVYKNSYNKTATLAVVVTAVFYLADALTGPYIPVFHYD